jgi:hypothetical protein
MASGSGAGEGGEDLTIGARLAMIQSDLDELCRIVQATETKQCRLQKLGNDRWDMLNKELKELREEI